MKYQDVPQGVLNHCTGQMPLLWSNQQHQRTEVRALRSIENSDKLKLNRTQMSMCASGHFPAKPGFAVILLIFILQLQSILILSILIAWAKMLCTHSIVRKWLCKKKTVFKP